MDEQDFIIEILAIQLLCNVVISHSTSFTRAYNKLEKLLRRLIC